MKIYLSPRHALNMKDVTNYTFKDETITLTFWTYDESGTKQLSESFEYDLSEMPEGELDMDDKFLLSAKRIDGELHVELLNYVPLDATHEELYPEWFDTEEVADETIDDDTTEESTVEVEVERTD